MKLSEVIQLARVEKPNSFTDDHLTLHINSLEQSIQDYLGIDRSQWVKYEWENDGGKELIAPPPYDQLYVLYLKAKIDYDLEEYESYQNNQALFEINYNDFKAWAMRSSMVIDDSPTRIKNWF